MAKIHIYVHKQYAMYVSDVYMIKNTHTYDFTVPQNMAKWKKGNGQTPYPQQKVSYKIQFSNKILALYNFKSNSLQKKRNF